MFCPATATIFRCFGAKGTIYSEKVAGKSEFSGIERRLDELSERLDRLRAIADRPRAAFDEDPFLRDIAERNLEIAAQCCIDIAQRIITLEHARKPSDYQESILILAELGVISGEFARQFSPIAGLRNVLVHEYAGIDWDRLYAHLQDVSDLHRFRESVLSYMRGGAR